MRLIKEKQTERLEIRIGPILKELADDVAKEHGCSLSEFVRDFLENEVFLYQQRNKKEP